MAWLGTWAKRIKISVDADEISAALTNFPIPVYLSASSGISDDDVSCVFDELSSDANRLKIAITTSDGTTQCYCEIEFWDDANEKAWLHIKNPSISSSADTDFYLYYDSSQSNNTTYVGDTDSTAAQSVWDSHFSLVHHMNQDPSGGSGCIKDSTSNNYDSTPAGTMLSGDLVSSKFGKGIDFDGSDDCLTNSVSEPGGDTEITLEVVVKPASFGAGTDKKTIGVFSRSGSPDVILDFSGNTGRFGCRINVSFYSVATTSLSTDTWYYLGGTWKSGEALSLLMNGNSFNSANTPTGSLYDSNDGFKIGYLPVTGRYINSDIDEIRVSGCKRSSAWRNATYKGLFDELLTFGSEEIGSGVSANLLTLKLTPKASEVGSFLSIVRPDTQYLNFEILTPEIKIPTIANASLQFLRFISKEATIHIPTVILPKRLKTFFQMQPADAIGNQTSFFYNNFFHTIGNKTHDLTVDTVKCCLLLSTYTPNVESHYKYSDVNSFEIAANGGYSTGGVTLTNKELFRSGNKNIFKSDKPYWDSFNANFRYVVLYNDSLVDKNLICYFDMVTDEVVSTNFLLSFSGQGYLGFKAGN